MADKNPNHGQVIKLALERRGFQVHMLQTQPGLDCKEKENHNDTSEFIVFKPPVGWNNDANNFSCKLHHANNDLHDGFFHCFILITIAHR